MLNAKKTNLMFLGTRFQTKNIDDRFDIYLDGCKLSREEAKFLGITIDENLSWKKQIDNVCKLCARNSGVLNKVKGVLHLWALYLKTLCIFSQNKATSDKVFYGSGQKCSKELKNHSFTSVKTIVVKLQ